MIMWKTLSISLKSAFLLGFLLIWSQNKNHEHFSCIKKGHKNITMNQAQHSRSLDFSKKKKMTISLLFPLFLLFKFFNCNNFPLQLNWNYLNCSKRKRYDEDNRIVFILKHFKFTFFFVATKRRMEQNNKWINCKIARSYQIEKTRKLKYEFMM